MVNVRIDENGLPKGPVFDPTTPAAHRTGVTAVDASDPADTSGAVDASGYQHCRFDIDITGTGFTSLEVQAIFWNSRQSLWFAGGTRKFTSTGRHGLSVDAQGAFIFLKVHLLRDLLQPERRLCPVLVHPEFIEGTSPAVRGGIPWL